MKECYKYNNHTGGAYGADTEWDLIGRKFGVTCHVHYRYTGNENLSKRLREIKGTIRHILSEDNLIQARTRIKELLDITLKDNLRDNLLARNYYQVINSDAVYAIAYINQKTKNKVYGGTNMAVQLAIKLEKPVYVWDLVSEEWHEFVYFEEIENPNKVDKLFDNKKEVMEFRKCDTPTLTYNFAGIGTRDIENYRILNNGVWEQRVEYVGDKLTNKARYAIYDVYAKTFNKTLTINGLDKLIFGYKEQFDKLSKLSDIGFDFYENKEYPLVEIYERLFDTTLKLLMTQEGIDAINWFIHENNYGMNEFICKSLNGKYTVNNIEELYNEIINYLK